MSLKSPRILVCPLNWGLGHATRCIPIVKELLQAGAEVIIGANGDAAALLKKEFPSLVHLDTPGITMKYSKARLLFPLVMASQFGNFKKQIAEEKNWLEKTIVAYNIDGVISDNRYGLYITKIPSVLITHQLNIKTGFGNWVDAVVNKMFLLPLLNRFSTIWIPDNEMGYTLGGELSHPKQKPSARLFYLGLVNRFANSTNEEAAKILVLLSGPEPQRTILEKKIIADCEFSRERIVIVRGLPASTDKLKNTTQVQFHNYLSGEELATEIKQAALVIARSGYSTLLEILPLQKKSILIPTPGQTEQEYLASKLYQEKKALVFKQKDFNFNAAITKARKFSYEIPDLPANQQLSNTVKNWLKNNF